MLKHIKAFLFLILVSSYSYAEDNSVFKCSVGIFDSNMNRLYSDIWDIKDFKKNNNVYHHLIYKENKNSLGLEFYQKVHVFFDKKDMNHLYLKADIQYDYKNPLMKNSDRKNYMFKDKIKLGKIKTYSNGTTLLSINCAKI